MNNTRDILENIIYKWSDYEQGFEQFIAEEDADGEFDTNTLARMGIIDDNQATDDWDDDNQTTDGGEIFFDDDWNDIDNTTITNVSVNPSNDFVSLTSNNEAVIVSNGHLTLEGVNDVGATILGLQDEIIDLRNEIIDLRNEITNLRNEI